MAKKSTYTDEEIMACTYACLYNDQDFGGLLRISQFFKKANLERKQLLESFDRGK